LTRHVVPAVVRRPSHEIAARLGVQPADWLKGFLLLATYPASAALPAEDRSFALGEPQQSGHGVVDVPFTWSRPATAELFTEFAGKFVAIVLLMLQLTSSGGTFPMQTVPRFFQLINPWLPMTYVVSGLRQAISGGIAVRGALFTGTAGGRLLAIDLPTGIVGWDGTVANPKGATELERIADVTSLPLVDQQQACAVAYQGRLACFDITRGTLNWSRDVSSLYGLAADAKYIYVTDDKGAVQALDRSNGASVWKQDLLAARRIGGPQIFGDFVGVVDAEGYLHLMSPANGAYVGRMATDGSAATSQPVAMRPT